ncbi:MAG: cytochrome-c oxidase, cbb3-type subunit III [Hyphomicrobiaceae bacterium]
MTTHHEIDDVTGVETTGHEWDGIKELNKPLPRWWLLTFYVCILWAVGYWVVYPAWPLVNGYTKGIWDYSQRAEVTREVKAGIAAQAKQRAEIDATPLADIEKNPELLRFAMAAGGAAFQSNCAPCHGRGAQGFIGYPNLNDDDWLWGGKVDIIYTTIQHGVRSNLDDATRVSQMPRFGLDQLLEPKQISELAHYVLALSGKDHDKEAAAAGAKIFADQCVSCHGKEGKGDHQLGAPNLTDSIWLYGGTYDDVVQSIRTGRGGVMPAWGKRLDQSTLKSLAVFVHSLGGGK